jgi:predicted metalloprotease
MLTGITGCAVAGQASIATPANPAPTAYVPALTIAQPTTVTQTMTQTVQVTSTTTAAPVENAPEMSSRETPSASSDRETAPVDGELYEDTAAAVAVTEGFWNDTFKGWDVVWHGPSLWAGNGFYDSAKRDRATAEWWTEGPECGERAPEGNAFFCTSGEVAWDRPLMEAGYTGLGRSFVYVVVAHEWGHAAQQRFIADGEGPAVLVEEELQADCLAGTTIAGAVDLGYLESEVADPEELSATLTAMGDEGPWHGAGDHGSSEQRVTWFTTGFEGGIEACLGNA